MRGSLQYLLYFARHAWLEIQFLDHLIGVMAVATTPVAFPSVHTAVSKDVQDRFRLVCNIFGGLTINDFTNHYLVPDTELKLPCAKILSIVREFSCASYHRSARITLD
tara:strand:- start:323 stop:646 length:324 start_codon:yes stop_codon:yes gene_type:complete